MKVSWSIPGVFWRVLGILGILGVSWGYAGGILEYAGGYSGGGEGSILEASWGYAGGILGVCWEYPGGMLGYAGGYPGGVYRWGMMGVCWGYAGGMLGVCWSILTLFKERRAFLSPRDSRMGTSDIKSTPTAIPMSLCPEAI